MSVWTEDRIARLKLLWPLGWSAQRIADALGEDVTRHYRILVDQPREVAVHMQQGFKQVLSYRLETRDAFFFNWSLRMQPELQHPFVPTHENMLKLHLHRDQPPHMLAANLRRAFSGIVAGNVKEEGMRAIEEHGPFVIDGEPQIMRALDSLLRDFVAQNRMKMSGDYKPCYRLGDCGPAALPQGEPGNDLAVVPRQAAEQRKVGWFEHERTRWAGDP